MEAEQQAKDTSDLGGFISIDDLEQAEWKGLLDEANLEIFLTWWSFGGSQHGITPMQAAEMPTTMRQDFSYMLEEIGRERSRQGKLEALRKSAGVKR